MSLAEKSTTLGLRDFNPCSWMRSNIVLIDVELSSGDTSINLRTRFSVDVRVEERDDENAVPFKSDVII